MGLVIAGAAIVPVLTCCTGNAQVSRKQIDTFTMAARTGEAAYYAIVQTSADKSDTVKLILIMRVGIICAARSIPILRRESNIPKLEEARLSEEEGVQEVTTLKYRRRNCYTSRLRSENGMNTP